MKNNLGKIRIEVKINDNIIQVYNSFDTCSLVINDKIEEQYIGVAAGLFSLKGKINDGENAIIVEAKMGFLFMKLYYDGKIVAKKFMGFG